VRLIRRADMLVAQILQDLPVIVAHPACKVWIVQVPVARGLRHVLQHTQALRYSSLSVRRQLLPLWQHIIFKVVPLLRRKPLPILSRLSHVLLLLRWQLIELSLRLS
jgi:hypothetical protein